MSAESERINDLTERLNDIEESLSNAQQRASTARGQLADMKIARTPEGQTKMATEAAMMIEDVFALGGMTVEQRRNRITSIIRARLDTLCQGAPDWRDC